MTRELDLAAAGSVSGLVGRKRRPKPAHTYTHCLNCGAELHGRFCQDCGQNADDHHRSILHLIWEAVEGLTELDGRLARTLPALFFHPGRLARDHIEGRRTRHVPPFRLFLISLLVFMLALEATAHRGGEVVRVSGRPATGAATPGRPASRTIKLVGGLVRIQTSGSDNLDETPDAAIAALNNSSKTRDPLGRWFVDHAKRASANREFFLSTVFEWAHRLAILLLPILALLMTGLYFYKRQFYVYDHLIVSMQFLSFVFLLWAVVRLTPRPLGDLAFLAATIWTPVNLFMTLRGAYGSSILGAAAKTLVLWISTLFFFLVLLLGLLALALGRM